MVRWSAAKGLGRITDRLPQVHALAGLVCLDAHLVSWSLSAWCVWGSWLGDCAAFVNSSAGMPWPCAGHMLCSRCVRCSCVKVLLIASSSGASGSLQIVRFMGVRLQPTAWCIPVISVYAVLIMLVGGGAWRFIHQAYLQSLEAAVVCHQRFPHMTCDAACARCVLVHASIVPCSPGYRDFDHL